MLKNLNNPSDTKGLSTSSPMGTKLGGKDRVAGRYGLSKNTSARYLRINYLLKDFKEMLDEGQMGIRVGVELSYLTQQEQKLIFKFLSENSLKLDMKKSEQI